MRKIILAINPGATSTKIAVYDGTTNCFTQNIKHSLDELSQFAHITDQYDYRKQVILDVLKEQNIDLKSIAIIMGRGGLIKPIQSGVYRVNDLMKEHLQSGYNGVHACNLGGLIADSLAQMIGLKEAFICDPVVVDEMDDLARISGNKNFERISIFHALNQKAIARTYAASIHKPYEELNLIVAHMGGGVSVGAHRKGKVVDVNQALDGEGPFSPERSGTLPMNQVIKACYSGKYTYEQMKKMIVGEGGLVSYLGTNDAYAVEKAAQSGDPYATLIERAMAYQIGKQIAENASVLEGKVDAILLTGGIAYGKPIVAYIKKYIGWIAPVEVFPGEDEMKSLAMNALMILEQKIEIQDYK
ncbi:MAG: butyrate kinase [Bacteroidales bacterium]|jgi:butyrate kinase|nr:butyrate kinase [Bacteroidales bacterium]MDD4394950.1 butyrate kinase [Bacteroidales bacterium]